MARRIEMRIRMRIRIRIRMRMRIKIRITIIKKSEVKHQEGALKIESKGIY